MVVDAAHRGVGVGAALMARAEDWAREHGYNELRLRTNIVRTLAHRFYLRLGYRLDKTSHLFCKRLGQ